jgi:hypothetical protein
MDQMKTKQVGHVGARAKGARKNRARQERLREKEQEEERDGR